LKKELNNNWQCTLSTTDFNKLKKSEILNDLKKQKHEYVDNIRKAETERKT